MRELTQDEYERYCGGCPRAAECHEKCEYCDKVLEVSAVDDG